MQYLLLLVLLNFLAVYLTSSLLEAAHKEERAKAQKLLDELVRQQRIKDLYGNKDED